jgi:hypothetical protein
VFGFQALHSRCLGAQYIPCVTVRRTSAAESHVSFGLAVWLVHRCLLSFAARKHGSALLSRHACTIVVTDVGRLVFVPSRIGRKCLLLKVSPTYPRFGQLESCEGLHLHPRRVFTMGSREHQGTRRRCLPPLLQRVRVGRLLSRNDLLRMHPIPVACC